jgi:hypothetical protein
LKVESAGQGFSGKEEVREELPEAQPIAFSDVMAGESNGR